MNNVLIYSSVIEHGASLNKMTGSRLAGSVDSRVVFTLDNEPRQNR